MLNEYLKEQLSEYLALMEANVVIYASLDDSAAANELAAFLEEVVALSDKLTIEKQHLERTPSFGLAKEAQTARIFFYGLPLGHEFSSFVLALLHVSGRKPQEEQAVLAQIEQIKHPLIFETYIKLSCRNCRDAVQALNIMSAINPNIQHTMIDGKFCQEEIAAKNIQKLPTVFMNQQELSVGRISLEQLVEKVLFKIEQEEGL